MKIKSIGSKRVGFDSISQLRALVRANQDAFSSSG